MRFRFGSARTLCAVLLVVFSVAGPSSAVQFVIDFESGFADGQAVSNVLTPDNQVGFSVTGGGAAFVTAVGNPRTAFVPNDTPVGGSPGAFFLSDEAAGGQVARDYFLTFATPITDLALDLYDFEQSGRTATLTVFHDQAMTMPVGTDTNPGSLVDGGVVNLSVPAPSGEIAAASLTFDIGDKGTGIDNIAFTTIPEPSTLLLSVVGLVGLLRRRHRFGRSR